MDHLRRWVLALFCWIEKILCWWWWWWRRKVTATLMWWLSNGMRIKCLHRRAKCEDKKEPSTTKRSINFFSSYFVRVCVRLFVIPFLLFCCCWVDACVCVCVHWICWFFLFLTNAFIFSFHSLFRFFVNTCFVRTSFHWIQCFIFLLLWVVRFKLLQWYRTKEM